MPAKSDSTPVLARQLLLQFGERLRRMRLAQGLSMVILAQRVGISRTTLQSVESGDPTPTMGTYMRVMSALGAAGDLALLASEALQPYGSGSKASKRPAPPLQVVVTAGDTQHEIQDLQSLMLHEEAIRLIHRRPELIQQALNTLDRWRSTGNSPARFLWDEWSVILHRKSWRKALGHTHRAKELRQASPLPTILPPDVRQGVLDQVQELKRGVTLGHDSSVPTHSQTVTESGIP